MSEQEKNARSTEPTKSELAYGGVEKRLSYEHYVRKIERRKKNEVAKKKPLSKKKVLVISLVAAALFGLGILCWILL